MSYYNSYIAKKAGQNILLKKKKKNISLKRHRRDRNSIGLVFAKNPGVFFPCLLYNKGKPWGIWKVFSPDIET